MRQALWHYQGGGVYYGKKSFAYPIPFLRGLFRVEMVYQFAVIVAAQADFRKYRMKRIKFPWEYSGMMYFLFVFAKIYNDFSRFFS